LAFGMLPVAFGLLAFGLWLWPLAFCFWHVAFGLFGIWPLALGFGRWALCSWLWALGFGLWALGFRLGLFPCAQFSTTMCLVIHPAIPSIFPHSPMYTHGLAPYPSHMHPSQHHFGICFPSLHHTPSCKTKCVCSLGSKKSSKLNNCFLSHTMTSLVNKKIYMGGFGFGVLYEWFLTLRFFVFNS
jgi:hypothetical protein